MEIKIIFTILFVIASVLAAGFFLLSGDLMSPTGKGTKDIEDLTAFATCITDSGAKMYGAYWCGHCREQKEMFKESWDLINYIECATPNGHGQRSVCRAANIQGYPTWEFGDGSRKSGTLSFDTLADLTGCDMV